MPGAGQISYRGVCSGHRAIDAAVAVGHMLNLGDWGVLLVLQI